jgi:peptidylprolyl isomerase
VSSANRERRQRNRDARAAAVEDAQRRAVRRRITFAIVGLALAAVVGIALVVRATSNGRSSASTPSTTSTASTTTTTLPSVKGKRCVAMKGKLPKNTPAVPVQVGPPPKQLVIRDLTRGTGAAVKPGATVKMNYVLVACSSGKVVQSSFETGQPITTPLDPSQGLIAGWVEGIPGMKVGGVRLLGVPPDLAYGSAGKGADIPPDETLWFVVKLVKIEK